MYFSVDLVLPARQGAMFVQLVHENETCKMKQIMFENTHWYKNYILSKLNLPTK